MGDETIWVTFEEGSLIGRFLCWIGDGHEWRYHLTADRRMCIGCGTKQVEMPRSIRVSKGVVATFDRPTPPESGGER